MTTTIDTSAGHGQPPPAAVGTDGDRPSSTWGRRLVRGRPEDPAWVRPALFVLLLASAVLYLWGLGASGWANAFYSAAVQAGSQSWKAFFFGSSDAANSITVDKPPASLWVMALSVRVFGLSSWSILVPQALMGVATVGVLYAAVRRHFSATAGLLAGATLALTPVAVLMFRFNNPDAMLMLVLTIAAYAVLRGIENARMRWLILAGALVGLGFLTKQLQAFLVLPAFGLAYLWAAPVSFGRRVLHLLAGFGAMILAAGWWIAIVELIPAKDRPYIGGSQHNSILELTFGYNGFGRLTGNETGSVGGGGGATGGGMWGQTGILRMFTSEFGGQIAWLLPAALILLVAGLWITRRAPRTDPGRAAFILWGAWLLVTGIVFSEMHGIVHPYYTVALAPALGALIGIGAVTVWGWRRTNPLALSVLAATVLVTAVWSYTLLDRSSDWHPWVRYVVVVTGVIGAAGLAFGALFNRRILAVLAGVAVISGLTGPAAYAVSTASTAHTGSIVSAGPTVAGGGFGGPQGQGRAGGFRRGTGGGTGGFGGGPQAGGQTGQGTTGQGTTGNGTAPQFGTGGGFGGGTGGAPGGGGRGGGVGGLLNGTTPSSALTAALKQNASSYTWVAATIGSQNASGYQLASQQPVMAIGGFNGSDPSPTLAQFKAYVAAGKIHYFVGAGSGLGGNSQGGSNVASQISSWVEQNYTATTIGGTTVYDLTSPSSASASSTATATT
jgi:4-amino-4-deoxy-L-arabinose transferase-like glycosyltransferase